MVQAKIIRLIKQLIKSQIHIHSSAVVQDYEFMRNILPWSKMNEELVDISSMWDALMQLAGMEELRLFNDSHMPN